MYIPINIMAMVIIKIRVKVSLIFFQEKFQDFYYYQSCGFIQSIFKYIILLLQMGKQISIIRKWNQQEVKKNQQLAVISTQLIEASKEEKIELFTAPKEMVLKLSDEGGFNLQYFSVYQFGNLTKLQLKRIDSKYLLMVSYIKCPNIVSLNLSYNYISDLSFLEKMKLPLLIELYLDHNYIIDLTPLTKMSLKNINFINLQNNQIDNLSPFLKLNHSQSNIQIRMGSNIKVFNQKLQFPKKIRYKFY